MPILDVLKSVVLEVVGVIIVVTTREHASEFTLPRTLQTSVSVLKNRDGVLLLLPPHRITALLTFPWFTVTLDDVLVILKGLFADFIDCKP